MLEHLLIVLNLSGFAALAMIQRQHVLWVKSEFFRNARAHDRIVKALPIAAKSPVITFVPEPEPFLLLPTDTRKTCVWQHAQPAPEPEDWSDDYPCTEQWTSV